MFVVAGGAPVRRPVAAAGAEESNAPEDKAGELKQAAGSVAGVMGDNIQVCVSVLMMYSKFPQCNGSPMSSVIIITYETM